MLSVTTDYSSFAAALTSALLAQSVDAPTTIKGNLLKTVKGIPTIKDPAGPYQRHEFEMGLLVLNEAGEETFIQNSYRPVGLWGTDAFGEYGKRLSDLHREAAEGNDLGAMVVAAKDYYESVQADRPDDNRLFAGLLFWLSTQKGTEVTKQPGRCRAVFIDARDRNNPAAAIAMREYQAG